MFAQEIKSGEQQLPYPIQGSTPNKRKVLVRALKIPFPNREHKKTAYEQKLICRLFSLFIFIAFVFSVFSKPPPSSSRRS